MFLNANNSTESREKKIQNKSIFPIGLFKYTFLTSFFFFLDGEQNTNSRRTGCNDQ